MTLSLPVLCPEKLCSRGLTRSFEFSPDVIVSWARFRLNVAASSTWSSFCNEQPCNKSGLCVIRIRRNFTNTNGRSIWSHRDCSSKPANTLRARRANPRYRMRHCSSDTFRLVGLSGLSSARSTPSPTANRFSSVVSERM